MSYITTVNLLTFIWILCDYEVLSGSFFVQGWSLAANHTGCLFSCLPTHVLAYFPGEKLWGDLAYWSFPPTGGRAASSWHWRSHKDFTQRKSLHKDSLTIPPKGDISKPPFPPFVSKPANQYIKIFLISATQGKCQLQLADSMVGCLERQRAPLFSIFCQHLVYMTDVLHPSMMYMSSDRIKRTSSMNICDCPSRQHCSTIAIMFAELFSRRTTLILPVSSI